ncbi:calcium-binding protein [Sphingomonas jatrophae]|uniref:Type I secretion C-terminal target domain (VC_A0849 subclass) n=1 Tax=Sphingomonas jatrophae TaxID=1166337 RepID=A0A1I6LDU5_9SPHN|nr:calcium-binding protein [Sphingomonas jatrophae]SFS01574.1 type I secretion C-terminal target domain (VC_A0849 subclass) [Sphingomonas jatrophae]
MAVIRGNEQNNDLNGTAGADEIYGYRGADTLSGGGGNDRLFGGAGNDRLYGNAGNDTIQGDLGDDVLWGGDGTDLMFGGGGNDRLIGGRGGDTLIGGYGADTFVYENIRADDIQSGFSIDSIYDFDRGEGDRIDLRGIDGNWNRAGDQPLRWIGERDFPEDGIGSVNVVYSAGSAYLNIDANGDGSVELGFELQDITRVYASDLFL